MKMIKKNRVKLTKFGSVCFKLRMLSVIVKSASALSIYKNVFNLARDIAVRFVTKIAVYRMLFSRTHYQEIVSVCANVVKEF
jgi:hypothetical protein